MNLDQIKQDVQTGVLVGPVTWKELLTYAIALKAENAELKAASLELAHAVFE